MTCHQCESRGAWLADGGWQHAVQRRPDGDRHVVWRTSDGWTWGASAYWWRAPNAATGQCLTTWYLRTPDGRGASGGASGAASESLAWAAHEAERRAATCRATWRPLEDAASLEARFAAAREAARAALAEGADWLPPF